jgi:hypothetical protein
MTHTLHRVGDAESLKKDFVIYGLSAQDAEIRDKKVDRDTQETHRRFMEICFRHDPVNAGCIYPSTDPYSKTMAKGNTWEEMEPDIIPFTETLAVFDDSRKVEAVIRDLNKADLGISVVVSGIFDDVFYCCSKNGLTPHTVNIALGIMGDQRLKPRGKILDIVTMCGHGLVSRYLVRDLLYKLKNGKVTAQEASRVLGAQCVCGAFNTRRAEKILQELVETCGEDDL